MAMLLDKIITHLVLKPLIRSNYISKLGSIQIKSDSEYLASVYMQIIFTAREKEMAYEKQKWGTEIAMLVTVWHLPYWNKV